MNIGIEFIVALFFIAVIMSIVLRQLKTKLTFNWLLIFSVVVSSCTIDLSGSSEAVSTPSLVSPPVIAATVPVTWSALNLTGSLVYISPPEAGEASYFLSIRKLNLLTGEVTSLFRTTGGDWIYYLGTSPDAKQLIMSYMPTSQGSSRGLYSVPLDGTSSPQLLFTPPTLDDHYVHAEWSPDGKYIYYAHYNYNIRLLNGIDPIHNIFRMSYPDGQAEKIAENAFWPRVSSDSTRLVFVSTIPESGKNELYVANADGTNAKKIILDGPSVPDIIDAPIFSPDGESVIFSAPPPVQAYQPNWLDKLMGIQIVKAHEIPSDWWSVPVTGGTPTQLTQLQTIRLFASLSPDKKHIASLSGEGIFVMDEMGSNLTQLLLEPGVLGTVSWIP